MYVFYVNMFVFYVRSVKICRFYINGSFTHISFNA